MFTYIIHVEGKMSDFWISTTVVGQFERKHCGVIRLLMLQALVQMDHSCLLDGPCCAVITCPVSFSLNSW